MIRQQLIRKAIGSERQAHGFYYQNDVIKRLKLREIPQYTAEYDAECQGTPIQIKCMKHGTGIQLGDYLRNRNKKHDFIMIIGFWENCMYNIRYEEIRYITHKNYTDNIGFHDVGNQIEQHMLEDIKKISNFEKDDRIWKEFRVKYRSLWPSSNNIDLRFVRDRKKQKRLQCGISWKNYNNWYTHQFEEIAL